METITRVAIDHRQDAGVRMVLCCAIVVLATAGAFSQDTWSPSSSPKELKAVGNVLFFTADDGIHGRELWRWRGESGAGLVGHAELVEDIYPGPTGSEARFLSPYGRWLYFVANTPDCQNGLWVCGSEGDPYPILTPDGRGATLEVIGGAGSNWFYFIGPDAAGKSTVFRTSLGSPLAESISSDDTHPAPYQLAVTLANDEFYYVNNLNWVSRVDRWGNIAMVHRMDARFIPGLAALAGGMFFVGNTQEHGMEPWITGGTSETTRRLRDINPGPAASMQHLGASVIGQTAYFGADDGVHGFELWKSDGVPDSTTLVRDIHPGGPSGDPRYFTKMGDSVFLVANDGEHGAELWTTDGTLDRTVLVHDTIPGPQGSEPWSLVEFKNSLWFCAKSPDSGEEIFVSDGTDAGTRVALDLVPGAGDSSPHNLTPLQSALFFTCDDGIHGEELWVSDGTMEQTRLASDIRRPVKNPGANPRHLTNCGERLFFTANDAAHGEELWSSDGTEAGTALVIDIVPGTASSLPAELTPSDRGLYFTAANTLWIAEPAGTPQARQVVSQGIAENPQGLALLTDRVYFSAMDKPHGRELWVSDGTKEGTRMIKEITPGPEGTSFVKLFSLWNSIWFYVQESEHVVGLWATDGTESGTRRLLGVPVPSPDWDIDNWESIPLRYSRDLSEELPEAAFLVPMLYAPENNKTLAPITLGRDTYFTCRTAAYGSELCRTDGTLKGLRLISDFFPGPSSSSPSDLCLLRGRICFTAEHPREGRVICHSDGTSEGTRPLLARIGSVPMVTVQAATLASSGDCLYAVATHLVNDPANSYLPVALIPISDREVSLVGLDIPKKDSNQFRQFTPMNDRLYLTFDDGFHGNELWIAFKNAEASAAMKSHLVEDILKPAE